MSKKVVIDFHVIPLPDPRVLAIMDNSIWQHLSEKASIIEITLPGEEEPIVHFFNKKEINSFNSVNLLVNCGLPCGCESQSFNPLPDGVYTITVKGSPSKFNKTIKYLRTNNARLELDKLFLNEKIKCSYLTPLQRQKIDEADFLLTAAEANTRLSQIRDAQELFLKAKSIIRTICK